MWDFCDLSLLPDFHSAQPSSCVLSLALSTRPLLILHRLQTRWFLLFFLFKASPVVHFTSMKEHCSSPEFHLVAFCHSWLALTHSAAFWLALFSFKIFTPLFYFLSLFFCLLLWYGRKHRSPIWTFFVLGCLPLVIELPLAVSEQRSYFSPFFPITKSLLALNSTFPCFYPGLSFWRANNNNTYLPLRGVVKIN